MLNPNLWYVLIFCEKQTHSNVGKGIIQYGSSMLILTLETEFRSYAPSPFCSVAALDSLPTPVWKFPPNDGALPDAETQKAL